MENIKLSDKQKEVIRLMRDEGCLVYNADNNEYRLNLSKIKDYYVPPITFIKVKQKLAGLAFYELTELGKTIQI